MEISFETQIIFYFLSLAGGLLAITELMLSSKNITVAAPIILLLISNTILMDEVFN